FASCNSSVISFLFMLQIMMRIPMLGRYQENAWSLPNECPRTTQPVLLPNSNNFSMDIRMPGVIPTASESYLCVAIKVPTERASYIVDFMPHASMDTAHHMLLYGCNSPASTDSYWECGIERGPCRYDPKIIYAWARNAPPTKLPKDVGFKVGGDTTITHFVLQIHYGDVNAFRGEQPYIAGIYLMMSKNTRILPGKRVTNADIECTYRFFPMYPFAFRTHTHQLGKVVSGYRVRDGQWTLIGRQSPQLPQAFYPAQNPVKVAYGDKLAARCVFTGEGKTSVTTIGGTSEDEMCNFYIMYYMDSKHAIPYMNCVEDGKSDLFKYIPNEANVPIPVSPDMMMTMQGHGHHTGREQIYNSALPQPKREEEDVLDQVSHLEEMTDWPEVQLQLGQVSGLALDSNDNLVIFHRGDHRWEVSSFDNQRVYQQRSLGPIQQSTILVVDPVKGNVLRKVYAGKGLFYLPHGISTDKNNDYWVTDVALHQVFKLGTNGGNQPLVVLGQAFEPGSDRKHFCQPTDVAEDPLTGNIYVSDGYCNSRILKFSPEGNYLMHWGAGSSDRRKRLPFKIPHSLTFLPDKRELCVADRENGRIQCFLAESGEFVKEIKKDEFGGEVFAVSYAPVHGGLIYAVNGESGYGQSVPLKGFVIDYSTKQILDSFSPDSQEFKMPHDIVVSNDGSVFVGDVATDSVIKFVSSEKAEHRSVKKGGIEVQEIEGVTMCVCVFLTINLLHPESETFVQTHLKPLHKLPVQTPDSGQLKVPEPPRKPEENHKVESVSKQSVQGTSAAIITTLLLIPLVVVIALGVFIRWRKTRMYRGRDEVKLEPSSSGGLLEKIRGKAGGGLNLGNFFATHKGYSRKGFDRLSTEGSDQEKDDEDATDSENEEYIAPPPPSTSS
uniref:Peptidylglycine alpha-amidating monooxygenase n=1 Tax=Scleropages formosus TaxID=113540 RepID=A0A8C9WF77_SCLFO